MQVPEIVIIATQSPEARLMRDINNYGYDSALRTCKIRF